MYPSRESLLQDLRTNDTTVCLALACLFEAGKVPSKEMPFMTEMMGHVTSFYCRPANQRRFPHALTPGRAAAVRRTMLSQADAVMAVIRGEDEIDWGHLRGQLGLPPVSPGRTVPPAQTPVDFAPDASASDDDLAAEFMGESSPFNERLKPLTNDEEGWIAAARVRAEAASIAHFGSLKNHARVHPGDFRGGKMIIDF